MVQDSHISPTGLTLYIVALAKHYAWYVIAAVLAITAILGWSALRVEVSSSLDELFPDEVARRLQERGQSRSERDLLIMAAESQNAFAIDGLIALDDAIQRISALEEVTDSVTLFNLLAFGVADNGRLTIGPISAHARAPDNAQEAELLKNRLLDDPVSRRLLISPDATTLGAVFNVPLRNDYEHLFSEIDRLTSLLSTHYDVHWGGNPTFEFRIKKRLTADLPRLLIAALAVIMISYSLAFRAGRAVFLPLLVVAIGTVWTIGTMRLLGVTFTVTSIMAPPLVLSLGSAYSVHVLTEYYASGGRDGFGRGTVLQAMPRVTATITLAALTTIIGFSSLLTGSLAQVREFGLITALGVAYCALLALVFLPACLRLLPPPRRVHVSKRGSLVLHAVSRLAEARWQYLVLVTAAVVAFSFVTSVGRIRYDTDIARMFGRDSQVVQDNLFVVRNLVGALDVNITMTAPEGSRSYFIDPASLQHIADLEHALRQDLDVAYVSSFVTQLSRMNHALRGTYEVPQNRALVGAFARLLSGIAESLSSELLLGSTVDPEFGTLTVNVRVTEPEDGGSFVKEYEYRETIARIRSLVDRLLPDAVGVDIWSNGMAILSVSDSLLSDHLRSAVVSLVLVFIVTAIGFRSVVFGAYALIPVATGLMTNFALMALAGIPLDAVTMTLSAMSIGVGVDHAIHLLLAYQREEGRSSSSTSGVISRMLLRSGRSVLISALSLAVGLLVLVTSTFPPIAVVGLLLGVLVLSTLIGSLVFLPAVLGLRLRGSPRLPIS